MEGSGTTNQKEEADHAEKLSCLLRAYGAQSPSNPGLISSPPFPSGQWLCKGQNQDELFRLLVTDQPLLIQSSGQAWKARFWRRVIDSLEVALALKASQEEEEIDERILRYYISLQQMQSDPSLATGPQLRTYFYGPLNLRQSWSSVSLYENQACISQGTTGLKSWGASVCLANYLILNPTRLKNVRILELGSGTGLLGILAHQLEPRNRVYLTDCSSLVLERLKLNVELNSRGSRSENLIVEHLDWNCQAPFSFPGHQAAGPHPSILILGADIIYDPELIPGLVSTIKSNLQSSQAYSPSNSNHAKPETLNRLGPCALICAVTRDPETWDLFLKTCRLQRLLIGFEDVREAIKLGSIDQSGIIFTQALDEPQSQIENLKLVSLRLDDHTLV